MTRVLVETLVELGVDVVTVERRFSSTVGEVGRFSLKKVTSGVWLAFRLTASLVTRRPELCIFFMTNRPASLIVDSVLSLILRALRIKTIGYIHTQGFSALAARNSIWQRLVSIVLGSAHALVCLSPILEEDIRPLAGKARLTSIPNTIPDSHEPPSASRETPVQVLYLSNLIPEKGIGDFVEIAKRVRTELRDVAFVAAGTPTSTEQLAELQSHAVESVVFVGQVGSSEKDSLLRASSVLAFPSRYQFEAQPLVILEAMSYGLPVVAYPVGGIPDVVTNGRNGILVEAGNTDAFRDAIARLVADKAFREQLGQNALNDFERYYSRTSYREAWQRELER
jgi:glycosyltransferase involved in cell wall biosynthesis